MRKDKTLCLLSCFLLACLGAGCGSNVLVTSKPPGADVKLNGLLVGRTPCRVDLPNSMGNDNAVVSVYLQGYEEAHKVYRDHPWWPNEWSGSAHFDLEKSSAGEKFDRVHVIACDLRIIAISDGSAVASASGQAGPERLDVLAKSLAGKLKQGMVLRGESVAVITLRNRSGTGECRAAADELADKVQGALIETNWFDVKERVDLSTVLDEKDLEAVDTLQKADVKKRLAGVKYLVIGGVTISEAGR